MDAFFDQIKEYKNNTLSPQDKQTFEDELRVNTDLQSAVEHFELITSISLGAIDQEVREIVADVKKTENKNKILRWLAWLLIVFIVVWGAYFIYQLTNQKNYQYASLYIDPAWPIQRGNDVDTLSDAIRFGLDGNILVAKNMIIATSLPQLEKQLWIAEIFAKNQEADSTLYYLPNTFTGNQQRDRIYYLRILSLYSLGKSEEVQKLLKDLPSDTDPVYKAIYEKLGVK